MAVLVKICSEEELRWVLISGPGMEDIETKSTPMCLAESGESECVLG